MKQIKFKDLDQLSEGLVLMGCGNPEEWVDGVTEMLQDEGISEGPIVWKTVGVLTTTGGRTDVVLEFSTETETINMGKMAIWRLSFGDASWISDYIVNYRDQHNAFDGGEGEVLKC